MKHSATRSPLRTKESEDFGTQETNEGFWEHFSGFLGCVVEEVLRMSQHIEQGLHEFLVLGRNKRSIGRRVLPKISFRGRYTTGGGMALLKFRMVTITFSFLSQRHCRCRIRDVDLKRLN